MKRTLIAFLAFSILLSIYPNAVGSSETCQFPTVIHVRTNAVLGKNDAFLLIWVYDDVIMEHNITLTSKTIIKEYERGTDAAERYLALGAKGYLFYINSTGVYRVYPRSKWYETGLSFSYPFIQYSIGGRVDYNGREIWFLGLPVALSKEDVEMWGTLYYFYILNGSTIRPVHYSTLTPLDVLHNLSDGRVTLNGNRYTFTTNTTMMGDNYPPHCPPVVTFNWTLPRKVVKRALGYAPKTLSFKTSPVQYCYSNKEEVATFCKPIKPSLSLIYMDNLEIWALPDKNCNFHYYVTTVVQRENGTFPAQILDNTTKIEDLPPYGVLLYNVTEGSYRTLHFFTYEKTADFLRAIMEKENWSQKFQEFSPEREKQKPPSIAGNCPCRRTENPRRGHEWYPASIVTIGFIIICLLLLWRKR